MLSNKKTGSTHLNHHVDKALDFVKIKFGGKIRREVGPEFH